MKTNPRSLVTLIFAIFTLPLISAEHPDTKDWKDLFSNDLSNAVARGKWSMKDGILVAGGSETLWTTDSFGDFILDLEFKVEKDANSGVFLRSGDLKDVLKSLEIQVHETADGSRYGMVGAIYDACPPSKNMAKPVGVWNHFTITCKGPLVTLIFNGEQVLNADLDKWTQARKNPDGTPNKFAGALKDSARKGPIGLQGLHGKEKAAVYYRHLKIRPLE